MHFPSKHRSEKVKGQREKVLDVGVQRWEKDKGDLRMQFILKDKELKDRAATEDRDEEQDKKEIK